MSDVDKYLKYDAQQIDNLRAKKPWMTDAKFFKCVQLSACAAMKMMSHAVSGVEQGMNKSGKPVEVMGLMLGHLCPDSPDTLVVTDAFPLPVEGAETRVLADDQEVMNYMIELGDSLEHTRTDRFMGWYHSHPFDVDVHSHCFLSSTDIATQLAWQRAEDGNGNPWLAIVVDPLRSLAKSKPELGAFRVYPPEYTAPTNEVPDGSIDTDDKSRVERWGSCWNRYHSIEVQYFMSSLSANVLKLISKNHLWMSPITSTPILEKENRVRFAERVNGLTTKLNESSSMLKHSSRAMAYQAKKDSKGGASIEKSMKTSCELSVEQLQSQLSQIAKYFLFSANTN